MVQHQLEGCTVSDDWHRSSFWPFCLTEGSIALAADPVCREPGSTRLS